MNYPGGRKQSRRIENDEMTTNQTTNSRAKRSKTQEVYQQYFPKSKKKKFVEHSIFLPIIQSKEKATRDYQHRSQRHQERSRQISRIKQGLEEDEVFRQYDSEESTMEYLNECEKIIDNLKKLTTISTNRLERKKPRLYSKNQSNQRNQNYTLNVDDINSEATNNKNYRNSRNKLDHSRGIEQKSKRGKNENREIKSQFNQYEGDAASKSSRIKKDSNPGTNNKEDGQHGQNTEISEQELKNQEELKKAQRKQKFLMKFLNKAKDRGCELHKKIAEFKMKRNQKVEPENLEPEKKKSIQESPTNPKKVTASQKNPESPTKPQQKLPDLKKPQQSPTKSKKT